MRYNTGIDFIQASGGNVIDVRHVEFEPVESPTLPSGTVWYEPTDGQTDYFAYQGSSGSFSMRTAEGISYYENTTLQQLSTSGPIDVTWDKALIQDNNDNTDTRASYTFLSSAGDGIIIAASGLYKMTYHVQFINNTGGGASDASLQAQLTLNDVIMPDSVMSTYLPNQANGSENYITGAILRMLGPGHEIKFQADFLGGTLSDVDVSDAYLEMEWIRREEFV